MGIDHKIFSHDEVSVHGNSTDCWVIINARAYDVTNFLDEHPGGEGVLLAAAGKDASEEFENAGHGSAARLMLDEYYVGEIDPTSNPTLITNEAEPNVATKHKELDDIGSSSSFSFLLKLLLSLLILGLAVAIHLYPNLLSSKHLF